LQIDNVFLSVLLRTPKLFDDIFDSHIKGGHKAKADPFIRGENEIAASAQNDGAPMCSYREEHPLERLNVSVRGKIAISPKVAQPFFQL
jgi:hypothetical protein